MKLCINCGNNYITVIIKFSNQIIKSRKFLDVSVSLKHLQKNILFCTFLERSYHTEMQIYPTPCVQGHNTKNEVACRERFLSFLFHFHDWLHSLISV